MILLSPIDRSNAKCDNCGALFHRKMYRLKNMPNHYCSAECRWEFDKKQNTTACENCGEMFYRVQGQRKRSKHHCCSKKCSNELHTGSLHVRFDATLRSLSCSYCGLPIDHSTGAKKYCSIECRSKANSGDKHFKYSQTSVNCDQCGILCTKVKSQLNGKNFCSKECQNTFHSNAMKAANNPRYKHGDWLGHIKPKLIYAGFTSKIRKIVRERDNNCCVVCGMTKEQHGQNLHVHHIDYDKANNELENLATVCKYCHGKIHGAEELWQKILSSQSELLTA